MYMCSERFTLESRQLSLLENPAARREGQETLEEDEALKKIKDDIAPISDIEESDQIDDSETGPAVKGASGVESTPIIKYKRRRWQRLPKMTTTIEIYSRLQSHASAIGLSRDHPVL